MSRYSAYRPTRRGTFIDLQAVALASDAVQADEARLHSAVRTAREHGRSWNQLAAALGVSRQAARQRFADKITN